MTAPTERRRTEHLNTPIVSVIVPVCNRPRQILACLQSLAAADIDGLEAVVVDDASTDDTPDQVERFGESQSKITVTLVRLDKNHGASGARRFGVESAQGKYVLFTDSDCTVDPTWPRKLVECLSAGNVVAACGRVIDEPPTNLAELWHVGSSLIERKMPNLIEGNMGLWRTVALEYPFDEALVYGGEGDDMALRLSLDGHQISFLSDAVVYHHHPMTWMQCMRRGYLQGIGCTRYWYKHDMYVGRDLLPLALALVTLPLGLIDVRLLALPVCFVLIQLAALAYNEVVLKRKSLWEAMRVYPVCVLFYAMRATAVLVTWFRLTLGKEKPIQASKRRWQQSRRVESGERKA